MESKELEPLDESLRYNRKDQRLTDNQVRLRMRQRAKRVPKPIKEYPAPVIITDDSWIVYSGPDDPPWT